jgi:hypothetical protein
MSLKLHIGLPKTGTTYIQKSFFNAREKIKEYIYYPDLGYYNQQLAMYREFNPFLPWNGPTSNKKWFELLSILKNNNKTFISAEAFSALNLEGIYHLQKQLNGIDIDSIIITVRSLEKLIPSIWQQNLKKGKDIDLKKHTRNIIHNFNNNNPPQILSYYNVIKLWKEVFENINFEILFMDGKPTQNIEAFAKILNLSKNSIHTLKNYKLPPSEQNLSLSAEECLELQRFNKKNKRNNDVVKDRNELLKSFFNAKNNNESYEKPQIDQKYLKQVQNIDDYMYKKVKELNHCKLHHGKILGA